MPASKAQRTATATRRAAAVALRIAGGRTWQAIADELGYASAGAAHADVTRALEVSLAEQHRNVDLYREEELRRLDELWAEAWRVLKRQHVTVSQGKVIFHDGAVLLDDGPVLSAVDRLLKIQERRARYLGLDAPTRHEVTLDEIDAQIRDLAAELGLGGGEADEAAGVAPAEADPG